MFQKELLAIVPLLSNGLPGDDPVERESRALVMLALFAGGVTLARSVRDKAVRDHIARVVRSAVIVCAAPPH